VERRHGNVIHQHRPLAELSHPRPPVKKRYPVRTEYPLPFHPAPLRHCHRYITAHAF
jgi:hypothetical protein